MNKKEILMTAEITPIKEYCGSCGSSWTKTIGTKDSLANNYCCSAPMFQSNEYCNVCMGTGRVYPHTVCPHCKGTGEKLDEE
ncbi:hypothetical protein LCGC14_1148180 [marine sediment metagenome]|uniref:CR-type domain-containing protein n=1 Tax=marine sediment metagenome TaxID=412755 RepID=A0A0F9LWC8_9ZZZZ